MAKKKNPQQEQPAAEEQEVDTPEEETPAQEEQPQEEPAQEQEETEEQEAGETPEEEDPQKEQPQEEQPPTQEPSADESAQLRQQLLQARGQIAAYAAGVAPGMVEDAVTLAMAEAAKAGEVTEAAVTQAMETVLKRHPEWKAASGDKAKGGFKLGADRDSGGYKKPAGNANQNVKRWNRFK